jgi:hypothetical protein
MFFIFSAAHNNLTPQEKNGYCIGSLLLKQKVPFGLRWTGNAKKAIL